MVKAKIIIDDGKTQSFLAQILTLQSAASSPLTFHQHFVADLWWKHFHSQDGIDFGTKRGRNFFGLKNKLEYRVWIIAENANGLCGIAPLVWNTVSIKGRANPLMMLSFCADSVVVFYQDLLIHPIDREDTVTAMLNTAANYASENQGLLFLGHIPEASPNIPFLQKAMTSLLQNGWKGGWGANRFRGGVYPWTLHKLIVALQALQEKLGEGDDRSLQIASLIEKLEKQGSALLGFPGTRIALEKEVGELLQQFRDQSDFSDLMQNISLAITGDLIKYPFIPLPKTPEEYLQSLSSSRRYYFRRYQKKFEEMGGSFENLSADQITEKDIEDYLQLHEQRWGADSVAVNDATLAFHRELSLAAAHAGVYRLFFARHEGKRIAAHVCFDIAGRREHFFSGRLLKAEELRAGKLLVMHTVLDAIRNGFTIYDFGYGGDEYKADFTKTWNPVLSFFLAKDESLLDLEKIFPKYEHLTLSH